MKQPEHSSIANRFQRLTSFYYLMVGVPLLAFSWIYLNLKFWTPKSFFQDPETAMYGHAVFVGFAVSLAVMAFVRSRRYYQQEGPVPPGLEGAEALEWKVKVFAGASVQRCLFLTASTLVVVLGFYMSLHQLYVPLYAVLLILFSVNRPSPERISSDMRMKKEEHRALVQALREREE